MGTYRVGDKELEFLRKHGTHSEIRRAIEGAKLAARRTNSEVFEIAMSEATRVQLLDELSDLFCRIGLADDHEPNSVGLFIESLIDRFNVQD